MPVPGFLQSFADKAQSAINASPLGSLTQQNTGGSASNRSHTIESFSNQLRVISQQYSVTSPIQKVITAEKSVTLDFHSVARDAQYQSKELFTWGKDESDDLKDVTDRLAYVNFIQGSLATSLAQKLDAARGPLKALRAAENAIAPRRAMRANLHNQIVRMEHEKGPEKKVTELKDLLRKVEQEDQPHEKGIEILKRKAIKESEAAKWQAIREYGEKLVLVSQAADLVIEALPAIPPSSTIPYAGEQATAAARASLQHAFDNYKTGHVNLPTQSAVDLVRSDTRSFGESHANELSSIDVPPSAAPHSPAHSTDALPTEQPVPPASDKPSTLTDVAAQTQSPAPSPKGFSLNVAETSTPAATGPDGSGSASESALDPTGTAPDPTSKAGDSTSVAVAAVPAFPSAEEEKKKLKETYSQEGARPAAGPEVAAQEQRESAEEEKKRLEREERERVLAAGGSNVDNGNDKDDEELPPYREL
ncbi:Eisosome component PIL1-domain-containing protein [Amanita rubescens]|nr:Eisosome component PIL1-domain-containing protein [Amanita rubescens]